MTSSVVDNTAWSGLSLDEKKRINIAALQAAGLSPDVIEWIGFESVPDENKKIVILWEDGQVTTDWYFRGAEEDGVSFGNDDGDIVSDRYPQGWYPLPIGNISG